jgi:hypothetical protein
LLAMESLHSIIARVGYVGVCFIPPILNSVTMKVLEATCCLLHIQMHTPGRRSSLARSLARLARRALFQKTQKLREVRGYIAQCQCQCRQLHIYIRAFLALQSNN